MDFWNILLIAGLPMLALLSFIGYRRKRSWGMLLLLVPSAGLTLLAICLMMPPADILWQDLLLGVFPKCKTLPGLPHHPVYYPAHDCTCDGTEKVIGHDPREGGSMHDWLHTV